VLRFSLREVMWLTLAFALGTAWQIESTRAAHWRAQVHQLSEQLETESLKQLAFINPTPYKPASYDPPLRALTAAQ
jgi:hypothetical protein